MWCDFLTALEAPSELLGIHTNFPAAIPAAIAKALQCGDPTPSGLSLTTKSTPQARLRSHDGEPPANAIRVGGFARRPGSLDA
jgi:hypothetical protein